MVDALLRSATREPISQTDALLGWPKILKSNSIYLKWFVDDHFVVQLQKKRSKIVHMYVAYIHVYTCFYSMCPQCAII